MSQVYERSSSKKFRRANPWVMVIPSVMASLGMVATSFATVCIVPDNGGTAQLPLNCPPDGYLSPSQVHMIINGLPPGNTLLLDASHAKFFNVTHGPGGGLGGERETFQSVTFFQIVGQGPMLGGFSRNVNIQAGCETHTAPRTPGMPVQSFDTDMFRIQGQINGDPDFDLLRVTAGTMFGMPSPGHTTLTQQPGGNWAVDSFFDITYRIDFVGAPGSILAGMSGSTTGTIRMQAGEPAACACQLYGDVVQNCEVDLDDILRILLGFTNPSAHPEADIAPCATNGTVDIDDILKVLGAFAGNYACAHPCPP